MHINCYQYFVMMDLSFGLGQKRYIFALNELID